MRGHQPPQMVAQRLGGEPPAREAGQQTGVRIVGAVARAGGVALERGAGDQQAQHRARAHAAAAELDGQPVEQFGMTGELSLRTEFLAGLDDAESENLLPEAIYDDASGERIFRETSQWASWRRFPGRPSSMGWKTAGVPR